jgi:hypothetical protein
VAVTWLLCNRRCSVERSATVYSSARFQLLVPRLGYGREHTAISIFAYLPLHVLSLLPGTMQRYRLGAASFAFSAANEAALFAIQCELAGLNVIADHGITLAVAGLPQRGLNRDCMGGQIGQQMIGSDIE